MARYLLIALNGPTAGEGDEADYNRWYNDKHLPDLRSVSGNLSARRFKVVRKNRTDRPYIAVSEFESDDPDKLMSELGEKASDFADSVDRSSSIFVLAVELDTEESAA
jgi:hypothetical protein